MIEPQSLACETNSLPLRHRGRRYAVKHESNCFALNYCMCIDEGSTGKQWPGIHWLTDSRLMSLHLRIESVNLSFVKSAHYICLTCVFC